MNNEQAENAVTISALVTTGIFAYRKAVEPGIAPVRQLREQGLGGVRAQNLAQDYKSVFGAAPPIEWGQWLKAAGSMFIIISIAASASPDIGGALAVLVGTSAVIGNGVAVFTDLKEEPGKVQVHSKREEAREFGTLLTNSPSGQFVPGTFTVQELQAAGAKK